MEKIKLAPPWVTYVNELKAMFENDSYTHIEYDDSEADNVRIYVNDQAKAEALSQLLPTVKAFGDFILKIFVIPANFKELSGENLIRTAFKGNPVLDTVMVLPTPFGDMTYGVFAKKVVQFQNDDMSDPNGIESTLYENIAKDIFESKPNTFWCTSNRDIPLKDDKHE